MAMVAVLGHPDGLTRAMLRGCVSRVQPTHFAPWWCNPTDPLKKNAVTIKNHEHLQKLDQYMNLIG